MVEQAHRLQDQKDRLQDQKVNWLQDRQDKLLERQEDGIASRIAEGQATEGTGFSAGWAG